MNGLLYCLYIVILFVGRYEKYVFEILIRTKYFGFVLYRSTFTCDACTFVGNFEIHVIFCEELTTTTCMY